jgi:hypothetical protein
MVLLDFHVESPGVLHIMTCDVAIDMVHVLSGNRSMGCLGTHLLKGKGRQQEDGDGHETIFWGIGINGRVRQLFLPTIGSVQCPGY